MWQESPQIMSRSNLLRGEGDLRKKAVISDEKERVADGWNAQKVSNLTPTAGAELKWRLGKLQQGDGDFAYHAIPGLRTR